MAELGCIHKSKKFDLYEFNFNRVKVIIDAKTLDDKYIKLVLFETMIRQLIGFTSADLIESAKKVC